jgi:hypothetical protein
MALNERVTQALGQHLMALLVLTQQIEDLQAELAKRPPAPVPPPET